MYFWLTSNLRSKSYYLQIFLLLGTLAFSRIGVAESCAELGKTSLIAEYEAMVEPFKPNVQLYKQRRMLIDGFADAKSIIGRNPEIGEILDRIEFTVLGREYLNGNEIHPNELLDLTVRLRQQMSAFAERVALFYKDVDSEASLLMTQVAQSLRVADKELNMFRRKIAATQDPASMGYEIQRTLISRAVGYLGEVQVVARVQNVKAVGRYVRKGTPAQLAALKEKNPQLTEQDLQKMAEDETRFRLEKVVANRFPQLGSEQSAALVSRLMNKEIDVIWQTTDGREAWGEIKNYNHVLSGKDVVNDYGGSRKTIVAQIEEFQILIEALSSPETPIELHHFPMNGVTQDGALVLQSEGAIVHFVVN